MVSWKERIEAGQIMNQALCNIDLFPTFCKIANCEIPGTVIAMDGIDISSVLFENASIEREIFWKFKKQTAIRSGKWKLFISTNQNQQEQEVYMIPQIIACIRGNNYPGKNRFLYRWETQNLADILWEEKGALDYY